MCIIRGQVPIYYYIGTRKISETEKIREKSLFFRANHACVKRPETTDEGR